jgi:hypothetical protein
MRAGPGKAKPLPRRPRDEIIDRFDGAEESPMVLEIDVGIAVVRISYPIARI